MRRAFCARDQCMRVCVCVSEPCLPAVIVPTGHIAGGFDASRMPRPSDLVAAAGTPQGQHNATSTLPPSTENNGPWGWRRSVESGSIGGHGMTHCDDKHFMCSDHAKGIRLYIGTMSKGSMLAWPAGCTSVLGAVLKSVLQFNAVVRKIVTAPCRVDPDRLIAKRGHARHVSANCPKIVC